MPVTRVSEGFRPTLLMILSRIHTEDLETDPPSYTHYNFFNHLPRAAVGVILLILIWPFFSFALKETISVDIFDTHIGSGRIS